MSTVNNLEPQRVFYYFDQMTKVPRCSHKEERIADYLETFAKDHQLEYIRDEVNNIIIKKEGTSGYEKSPPLIIQGHMDMVCEKNENCEINFEEDPIPYVIEGDYMLSHETTLGADNGIAVAMALAILESEQYAHPPLEVLVTVNEEDGMTGAKRLKGSSLAGQMLLNLDSEREGVACVSCAGGERDYLIFPRKTQSIEETLEFFELSVTGLKGGHSGQDISKGLGNSNRLLARALYRSMEEMDLSLIDLEGGAKPNAIPRYAKAIIGIKPKDRKNMQDLIVELNREFVGELGKVDPNVRLNFEPSAKKYEKKLEDDISRNIIYLINVLPNGVQSMSRDIEGLVESSVNIGVIESHDEEIRILTNIRSSSASRKEEIAHRHRMCAALTGATFDIQSAYPAWEYRENSHLRDVAIQSYRELTGKELELEAIHAGLECGIFVETIGPIDMLSIGPNISGPHAPGENLQLSSTKRVFDFVLEILKNLK